MMCDCSTNRCARRELVSCRPTFATSTTSTRTREVSPMNRKRLDGGQLTRRAFVQGALGAAGGVAALGLWPGLGEAQTATKPIKIGVSLPLTGVFAIAGQKHRDGYTFWANQINKD